MMALGMLLAAVAGFAALALGMERHARNVLGVAPSRGRRAVLRLVGWLLLAVALAIGLAGWSPTVGVVEWTAALTMATVPLIMLVMPRFLPAPRAAVPQRVPLREAAPGRVGRAWRVICAFGLVALPVFMVWAYLQIPSAPV